MSKQREAENIAEILFGDGLIELLRENIQERFGVALNPDVLQLLLKFHRKDLAMNILALVESTPKKSSANFE